MIYGFYRFTDPDNFRQVCQEAGFDPDQPPVNIDIDPIGPIWRDGDPVVGWHVNIAWNSRDVPEVFQSYSINPQHPDRVFLQRSN